MGTAGYILCGRSPVAKVEGPGTVSDQHHNKRMHLKMGVIPLNHNFNEKDDDKSVDRYLFFQTDPDNQKEHSLEGLGCGYRRSWWDGTDATQKELAPLTTCFY